MEAPEHLGMHVEHILDQQIILSRILDCIKSTATTEVKTIEDAIRDRDRVCVALTCVTTNIHSLIQKNKCVLDCINFKIKNCQVLKSSRSVQNTNRNISVAQQHPPVFNPQSVMSMMLSSDQKYKVTYQHQTAYHQEKLTFDPTSPGSVSPQEMEFGFGIPRSSTSPMIQDSSLNRQVSGTSDYASLEFDISSIPSPDNEPHSSSYNNNGNNMQNITSSPALPSREAPCRKLRKPQVCKTRSSEVNTSNTHDHSNAISRRRTEPNLTQILPNHPPNGFNSSYSYPPDSADESCRGDGTSAASSQCVREGLRLFIKLKLSSTNDWYEFERFGLKLNDGDINHINDNCKENAFARKFEKLQLWAKGKKFKSTDHVVETLQEVLQEMNDLYN